MNALLLFAAAASVTWALRASFIALLGGRTPSPLYQEALGAARHAVLAALVVAAVAGPEGSAALLIPSPRVVAAGVALAVAWYTRGMLRTVGAGVATMAVLGLVWA